MRGEVTALVVVEEEARRPPSPGALPPPLRRPPPSPPLDPVTAAMEKTDGGEVAAAVVGEEVREAEARPSRSRRTPSTARWRRGRRIDDFFLIFLNTIRAGCRWKNGHLCL